MGVIEDVHEQLRLEAAKLGAERRALDDALKAVQQALDALDGQAVPDTVASLAAPPRAERAPRRVRIAPRAGSRPTEAPRRKPGRPRKVAPAPELAAKRKPGRPRKVKPPKPEDLKPITRDMPGVVEVPPHAVQGPTGPGGNRPAVLYRICPNCKKRTQTNPCHVCGDKLVVIPNLMTAAPAAAEE